MIETWGLHAAQPVAWLVRTEADVWTRVAAFIDDKTEPVIDVAGPASLKDFAAFKSGKSKKLMLPCIRLHLRKSKHHLTGQRMVEIRCSDGDLETIESWRIVAAAKAAGTPLGLN